MGFVSLVVQGCLQCHATSGKINSKEFICGVYFKHYSVTICILGCYEYYFLSQLCIFWYRWRIAILIKYRSVIVYIDHSYVYRHRGSGSTFTVTCYTHKLIILLIFKVYCFGHSDCASRRIDTERISTIGCYGNYSTYIWVSGRHKQLRLSTIYIYWSIGNVAFGYFTIECCLCEYGWLIVHVSDCDDQLDSRAHAGGPIILSLYCYIEQWRLFSVYTISVNCYKSIFLPHRKISVRVTVNYGEIYIGIVARAVNVVRHYLYDKHRFRRSLLYTGSVFVHREHWSIVVVVLYCDI